MDYRFRMRIVNTESTCTTYMPLITQYVVQLPILENILDAKSKNCIQLKFEMNRIKLPQQFPITASNHELRINNIHIIIIQHR